MTISTKCPESFIEMRPTVSSYQLADTIITMAPPMTQDPPQNLQALMAPPQPGFALDVTKPALVSTSIPKSSGAGSTSYTVGRVDSTYGRSAE